MLSKKELKLIEEFQKRMVQRMEMGSRKYGRSYLKKNVKQIKEEAIEEVLDLANYAMQIYMKLKW